MSRTTKIIWAIYISLLAVLLPHTAWLFMRFEDPSTGVWAQVVAWAAAFAFEASIATLTHRLARHIETTPKRFTGRRKFAYRYLNAYSLGLVISLAISALANLAHAVEFGQDLTIFARWGIPQQVYQFGFGAVLPFVSLLFARVLSNVSEAEAEEDPEVTTLRSQLVDVRSQLRTSEKERGQAQERLGAVGDLFTKLFAPAKRERIMAAHEQWPELPAAAIAIMCDSSASYVSEVLGGK
ncbi:MAG TPA: hypothetical protein VFF78_07975 [Anaerolineaceae bacterium]|nr:hypothetical protein [Anaerolineaceae bacterium]